MLGHVHLVALLALLDSKTGVDIEVVAGWLERVLIVDMGIEQIHSVAELAGLAAAAKVVAVASVGLA